MDKHLEEYLALCQRIYERMEREGNWPFKEPLEDINNTQHEGEK